MVEVGEKFEIGWMFRVGTLSAAMKLPSDGRGISPLQLCRCRCSVAVPCWLFSIGGVEGGRPGSKEQRGEFRGGSTWLVDCGPLQRWWGVKQNGRRSATPGWPR